MWKRWCLLLCFTTALLQASWWPFSSADVTFYGESLYLSETVAQEPEEVLLWLARMYAYHHQLPITQAEIDAYTKAEEEAFCYPLLFELLRKHPHLPYQIQDQLDDALYTKLWLEPEHIARQVALVAFYRDIHAKLSGDVLIGFAPRPCPVVQLRLALKEIDLSSLYPVQQAFPKQALLAFLKQVEQKGELEFNTVALREEVVGWIEDQAQRLTTIAAKWEKPFVSYTSHKPGLHLFNTFVPAQISLPIHRESTTFYQQSMASKGVEEIVSLMKDHLRASAVVTLDGPKLLEVYARQLGLLPTDEALRRYEEWELAQPAWESFRESTQERQALAYRARYVVTGWKISRHLLKRYGGPYQLTKVELGPTDGKEKPYLWMPIPLEGLLQALRDAERDRALIFSHPAVRYALFSHPLGELIVERNTGHSQSLEIPWEKDI